MARKVESRWGRAFRTVRNTVLIFLVVGTLMSSLEFEVTMKYNTHVDWWRWFNKAGEVVGHGYQLVSGGLF